MYLQEGRSKEEMREVEANEFASELLLPAKYVDEAFTDITDIDLNPIIDLSEIFDISKAAALRKIHDTSEKIFAIIFSLNGLVTYLHADRFPYIKTWAKKPLPKNSASISHQGENNSVSKVYFPDQNIWLGTPINKLLSEQIMVQENGRRITLLKLT